MSEISSYLFALESLRRLIGNNYKFSVTELNNRELDQRREESDNVLSFVGECCELGEGFDYGSTIESKNIHRHEFFETKTQ